VVGFDFPIGVPARYARIAGVDHFLTWLPTLGVGAWGRFYDVAKRSDEISTHRPFYPFRSGKKGEFPQCHLLEALGADTADDLRRQCEVSHDNRPAASPLFWTMGAKQVGKAAVVGWREVLEPSLRDPELALDIWPFSGHLDKLLRTGNLVVVETYPAEFYHHLDVAWPPGPPW
jgi:hypothetical protein